jgi:hypothetical protein
MSPPPSNFKLVGIWTLEQFFGKILACKERVIVPAAAADGNKESAAPLPDLEIY